MSQGLNEPLSQKVNALDLIKLLSAMSNTRFSFVFQTLEDTNNHLSEHTYAKNLAFIYQESIQLLRQDLYPLFILSSGYFKPKIKLASIAAYTHASGHLLTHLVHCCHLLHNLFALTPILFPIIGLMTTHLEHITEERLLEKLSHHYKKFTRYSSVDQDLIFQYMVAYAMSLFLANLKGKPNKKQAVNTILTTIQLALLLIEDSHDLERILISWRTAISVIFQAKGFTMALHPREVKRYYTEAELRIAYSIQQIFTRSDKTVRKEFLVTPKLTNFAEDIHRRIFQEVIKPFTTRASASMLTSWYLGYSTLMLETLKLHHSRLIEALTIINANFIGLDRDTENYRVQMQVINLCLLTALQQFAKALPWHPSSSLFIELIELYPQYSFNPEPIIPSRERVGYFELSLIRDVYIDRIREELEELRTMVEQLKAMPPPPVLEDDTEPGVPGMAL